jgi:hypothetical protein
MLSEQWGVRSGTLLAPGLLSSGTRGRSLKTERVRVGVTREYRHSAALDRLSDLAMTY